jgi:ABC-type uncharacterized transport system fused permease/ATPase subunit
LILLYKNVTQLAGYTARVSELREVLLRYSKEEANKDAQPGKLVEGDHIQFEGVSIVSPDNVVLLESSYSLPHQMDTQLVRPV